MAEAKRLPATPEIRERWGAFAWTAENEERAKTFVDRYPPGLREPTVQSLAFVGHSILAEGEWSEPRGG